MLVRKPFRQRSKLLLAAIPSNPEVWLGRRNVEPLPYLLRTVELEILNPIQFLGLKLNRQKTFAVEPKNCSQAVY
ncbi:hypothetical protein PSEUDO8Z_90041 [Pseudomonas sp. 8Z]|nr:hypothetical protein PSEUDO8Z_90041 [Pseudomonas sp. 8Z]